MSHRYSHIRNLGDLGREIALLRVRKHVILQEAVHNVSSYKQALNSRFALLKTISTTLRTLMAQSQNQDETQRKGFLSVFANIASALVSLWVNLRK
jgi:hypothetical protein